MAIYDDYVWRLTAESPAFDLQLPKDLEWVDEFTWTPVNQTVSTTLSGALVIQESLQKKGRPLTLVGKDDMGWIKRTLGETLMQMRNVAGLVMRLRFQLWNGTNYLDVLHDYQVMFRHYDAPPIDLEHAKRFDNFEPDGWYKVRNLKFMEAVAGASSPCSANVTLTVSGVSGTFTIGQAVTGGTSGTIGRVMQFNGSTTLELYVEQGEFESGEAITGASGSATVV